MIEEYVSLPKSIVESTQLAEELLTRIFPDMEFVLQESQECWRYLVRPCSHGALRHDPLLFDQLRSWLNLDPVAMFAWHQLRQPQGRIWLEAFQHSWALLAWSHWVATQKQTLTPPLILHVDAHNDLGSSNLLATRTPGCFAAAVGDATMNFSSPESVARFIERGLIGIGNFLVPLLWTLPGCELFHVTRHPSTHTIAGIQRYQLAALPAIFGSAYLSLARPSPAPPPTDAVAVAPFTFCEVADLDQLAQLAQRDRPIFLDIDMDYFALLPSRNTATAMPTQEEVLALIAEFGRWLGRSGLRQHIAVVTVAYSPGFFPSAWLPMAVPALRNLLEMELQP